MMLTLIIIKAAALVGAVGLLAFTLSRIDRRAQVRRMYQLRKQ
jgi:hypothetical protein